MMSRTFRNHWTDPRIVTAGALLERLESRHLLSAAPIVRPDHVVVVIEEDRAADAIGDTSHMPYFNQLAAGGLVYTDSHGVAHPSLPDYLALYSGSTQGVTDNGSGYTFAGTNLAKVLNSTLLPTGAYLSFGGYTESLPRDGDVTTRTASDLADTASPPDLYMRIYNPMAQFSDVGTRGGTPVANATVNRTFASFPTTADGFAALPTVSFVIPNNLHNTHGSNEQAPYATDPSEYDFLRTSADTWLRDKMDAYLQWARSHNSLLIVTTDEEETDSHATGTITTIVAGDPAVVVPGRNANRVNHFNLLRTIGDMYGLAPLGASATAARFDTNAQGQLAPSGQAAASTVVTVTSGVNPVAPGQAVTFTATVSAAVAGTRTPTGGVTFKDGAAVLGAATLDASGRATLTVSGLAPGSHSITAVYGGDATFAGATSGPLSQSVTGASNNNFASRTALTGTSVSATGSTAGATKEAGEPNHAGKAGGKSVWWTWTAPSSGTVTIDTLGSSFDTLLAVYTGTSVSALAAVAGGSNDDSPTGGTLTSKVTVTVTAGVAYPIAVDGYNGQSGSVTLHLKLAVPVPPAPTGVAASDGAYADKVGVTWSVVSGATAYEVWRATTNNSAKATRVAADIATASFDDTTANAGVTYWYWVKAKNASGTSGFSASGNSGVRAIAGPVNDHFANRTLLTGTSITATGSTVGATKEAGEPNHAGNAGGKSVWWTWTAPSSGSVTIDTLGSAFDTLLGVYTGSSVSALLAVPGGSNDDSPAGGTYTSRVTFAVTAGVTYQIAIGGYNGQSGSVILHLNLA
jgi:hypothetical protein